MISEWVKDLEAKVDAHYDKRSAHQLHFLYDLQQTAECLGSLKLKTKRGYKERLLCYVPKKQQGWILERENGKLESMVSYGYLTKEEFIRRFYSDEIENAKIAEGKKGLRHYSLLALPLLMAPAAAFAIKKYLDRVKEEEKEDKENGIR